MNQNRLKQYVSQVMKDNYDSIIKYDSVADYFCEYIDTNDSLLDIANAAQDELKYFFSENYNAPVDYYINDCNDEYEIIFYSDDSCIKWCRDHEIFDDVSPEWFFQVLDENFLVDVDFRQTTHYTFLKKGVFEKMVEIFKQEKSKLQC